MAGLSDRARGPRARSLGHGLALALIRALALLLLAGLGVVGAAHAQPKFPSLTGRIVDEAGIISSEDRQKILETLRVLEQKSTDQIVVYTTKSLQGYPIEDFGYQLGRHWQIGQKDKNNGIILIVAPNERKVRIEVGRGLEPQMTDLMSGLIIRNVILPAFRRGDFSGGVRAGVHDIRDVLLGDAAEVKRRAEGGQKRSTDNDSLWPILLIFGVFIAIFAFTAWQQQQQLKSLPYNERYRRAKQHQRNRGNNGGVIIVPSGGGSSGGWSWGGGSGSSDSGWSSGGGDFGGGGASGDW